MYLLAKAVLDPNLTLIISQADHCYHILFDKFRQSHCYINVLYYKEMSHLNL